MKELRRARPRLQSAMEYLMTYGWAILIIAVVLGALYSLGVFNAVNFMPKVPGGGCHVFRPNGPGTSWNVNLVGSCNNALPQYVAQFNGQSSQVAVSSSASLNYPFTWTVWTKILGSPGGGPGMLLSQSNSFYLSAKQGTCSLSNGQSTIRAIYGGCSTGVWYQVSGTYDGTTMYLYVNGVQVASIGNANSISLGNVYIGSWGGSQYYNGIIANVQIYNTSLTANQVAYLYNEGIGGVPISPQYLVGWWPLNGDANDYSGNNNNGAATAITFNGTWTGGYVPP